MIIKKLIIASLVLLSTPLFASEEDKNANTNSYKCKTTVKLATNMGEMISFPTIGKSSGHGYLLKAKTPSNNWLFIHHDKWGLTESVKQEAISLWTDLKNVNVLIIDLNDGQTPNSNPEAMRLLLSSDPQEKIAIIKGAIQFAGSNAKIGSLGWSNGGAWSLQTAIHAGIQDVACVMYYGMPESNVQKLSQINTDVLAIYGDMDTYITPRIARVFKSNMQTAGKNLIELTYQGKGNFADKSSDKYNYNNASQAYVKVLNYLSQQYL